MKAQAKFYRPVQEILVLIALCEQRIPERNVDEGSG